MRKCVLPQDRHGFYSTARTACPSSCEDSAQLFCSCAANFPPNDVVFTSGLIHSTISHELDRIIKASNLYSTLWTFRMFTQTRTRPNNQKRAHTANRTCIEIQEPETTIMQSHKWIPSSTKELSVQCMDTRHLSVFSSIKRYASVC